MLVEMHDLVVWPAKNIWVIRVCIFFFDIVRLEYILQTFGGASIHIVISLILIVT